MAPVTKPHLLTRKLGPAPVWLWAAAALTLVFVLMRSSGAAAGAALPSSSTSSGGAQPPASGQGTPADNMTADQLASLLGNLQASTDALLQAVQSQNAHGAGGGGTASNAPQGAVSQSGAASEPTIPREPLPPDSQAANLTPGDVAGAFGYVAQQPTPSGAGVQSAAALAAAAQQQAAAAAQAEHDAQEAARTAQGYHTAGF